MKESIRDFTKAKWWHVLLMAGVSLLFMNMGLAMALDPGQSKASALAVAASGLIGMVSAVLVFLERRAGYILSIIASGVMMATGYIKISSVYPDVFLIDFLLAACGFVLMIVSIFAMRRYTIDNPDNKK